MEVKRCWNPSKAENKQRFAIDLTAEIDKLNIREEVSEGDGTLNSRTNYRLSRKLK